MKVEKTISKYLSGDYAKDNQVNEIKILTEAKYESGEYGEKLVCMVLANDETLLWTINPTSKNALIDAFGEDTAKWVNAVLPIETALMANQKRAIFVDLKKLGGKLN